MRPHARQTPSFHSAREKIFLGIVLVPLVPYPLVVTISSFFLIDSLSKSSQATMRQIVENQATVIERYLDERLNDLDQASGS
jgi:nitrogen fixation/metabolism regulation signal transduction histidine kinase